MKRTDNPQVGQAVCISLKSRYHTGEAGTITAVTTDAVTGWKWYEVTFPDGSRREFGREQMEVLDAGSIQDGRSEDSDG